VLTASERGGAGTEPQELNIPEKDVEALLVSLILDSRVSGHIDQVNQLLELGDQTKGKEKYIAVNKWTTQLASLHSTVINKIA
jgi:COP9 signalosome complex subunit 2